MNRDKIPPGQLKKILEYNRTVVEAKAKADAGLVLAEAIKALPKGQRKHFLTDEVMVALDIFGINLNDS